MEDNAWLGLLDPFGFLSSQPAAPAAVAAQPQGTRPGIGGKGRGFMFDENQLIMVERYYELSI